ncbi:MAG TPA: hypothetical protein VMZ71_16980 [Gemmataceae bacterium]|nr:hypothetical protein [Gemmataceae bacterium]
MGDRVWKVPQADFVAAWEAAATLAEVTERVRELAGGMVPRWAVMARAAEIRKAGVELKPLRAAA